MGVATERVRCQRPGMVSGFGRPSRHHAPPPGGPQAGVSSIMKRKEEPADPETHQRSLQFVGVNGR